MEEKIIVYVAGNPDSYPLEYYDKETDSYQGVIPQLLQQFSSQSGYEIRYYSTQPGKDQRKELGKNLQVDILSGYAQGDQVPLTNDQMTIFRTDHGGEEKEYYLCFTQVASEDLKEELEEFFDGVTPQTVSGILLETSVPVPDNTGFYFALGALAVTAVVLATAIVLLVRKYRRKLREMERGFETDEVTGLGNFDYLIRYFKQFINDKNRILYSLVYFYVDTDRLRRMGSSQEVDEFLRYCAVILQEHCGDADILAKVSGHGFALLKFSGDVGKIKEWIEPVFHRLHDYAKAYGKAIDVSTTAGIYPLKNNDRDLNEMIFNASQGALEARKSQRDYVICSDETLRKMEEEKRLCGSIRKALEDREIRLYIQFYVDIHTRKIVGGEALSRWQHPQKGLLMPGTFVPMLEREGVIGELDYYCLRESCAFLQELADSGVQDFFVSCNFSRDTFGAEDFVAQCIKIMDGYRFPRELLIFELTESASAKRLAQIRRNMLELKKYGVSIALDDFGEGFTSFYDLQQYPVDGIKLDKGLIDNILTPNGIAILRAVVQVGHDLGLTILAEGVENESQVAALGQINCDVVQGFQFYAPIPEWEAREKVLEQFPRQK